MEDHKAQMHTHTQPNMLVKYDIDNDRLITINSRANGIAQTFWVVYCGYPITYHHITTESKKKKSLLTHPALNATCGMAMVVQCNMSTKSKWKYVVAVMVVGLHWNGGVLGFLS